MTAMRALLRSRSGSAAVEMALVTPLLLLLLFGSAELGKFFMDEHVVVKAVRDGARYAARQPMDYFVTAGGGCQTEPVSPVDTATKNVVRTGNVAGTGNRLYYWTNNATITVTSSCYPTKAGQTMGGIYSGITFNSAAVGAPVVTVSATVPYTSLFGLYRFRNAINLNAVEQAAVTGV